MIRKIYFILLFFVIGCGSDESYFPHDQGILWNYNILFTSDYTGNTELKRLSITNTSLYIDKEGISYAKVYSNGNIISFLKEKKSQSLMRTNAVLKSSDDYDEPVKKTIYPSTQFKINEWKTTSQLFITRGFQPPLRGFIPSAVFEINHFVKKRNLTVEVQGKKFVNCIYILGKGKTEFIADTRSGPIPIDVETKEWLCKGVGLVKEERIESTNASAFGNMVYKAELVDFKN